MKKLPLLLAIILLIGCASKVKPKPSKVEPQTYSQNDRLLWLSNIWKDVSNNFFDPERLVKMNWDSVYVSYIPLVEKADKDSDYFRLLQRFMATVQDGHTQFGKQSNESILPVGTEYVGGKYYITEWEKSTYKDLKLPQEIISVDGIEFGKYLENSILPYIGGSTVQSRRLMALFYFETNKVSQGDQVKFELRGKDGKTNVITVPFVTSKEYNSMQFDYVSPIQHNVFLDQDKNGTDFFRFAITSFQNYDITPLILANKSEIEKSKYIIIDLRRNGGGNSGLADTLLMSLLDIDTLKTYKSQYRVYDGLKAAWEYGAKDRVYYENRSIGIYSDIDDIKTGSGLPTFTQPLYVLVGPRTASAAEDFLIPLRINYPDRAIIFGMPTFGSTGQPLMRQMPGGCYYRVCCRGVIAPFDFNTEGIVPDVIHETAIEEYISGIDEIYNVVADYYKRNNK